MQYKALFIYIFLNYLHILARFSCNLFGKICYCVDYQIVVSHRMVLSFYSCDCTLDIA